MADGSTLPLADNAALVAGVAIVARQQGVAVEAEMGRLSGTEDGWTIQAREARLTDPGSVPSFLADTGADLLAVSIGNVHGSTPVPPMLDLDRLEAIARATAVPLVLHGGSGLDDGQLAAAIALGVSKVNVNTELRTAYRDALTSAPQARELVDILGDAHKAVGIALRQVLERLGSVGLLDRYGWGGTRSDGAVRSALTGRRVPPAPVRKLRAGPVTCELDGIELRDIRFGQARAGEPRLRGRA